MKSPRWFFPMLFSGLFLGMLLTPLRDHVRPVYGQAQYGLLSWVLGWLPNGLAALAMTLQLSAVVLLLGSLVWPPRQAYTVLGIAGASLFTAMGLAWWEYYQQGPGDLRYDVDDLWATAAGCALGALLSFALRRRLAQPSL